MPESGNWGKVGGATVHFDESGTIDKGCPGLEGETVESLDDNRDHRAAKQDAAEAAGWQSAESKEAEQLHAQASEAAGDGALVFVRIGDKLRTFGQHAQHAKAALGMGDGQEAEFDHEHMEKHLATLIKAGHRVAIVERAEQGGARPQATVGPEHAGAIDPGEHGDEADPGRDPADGQQPAAPQAAPAQAPAGFLDKMFPNIPSTPSPKHAPEELQQRAAAAGQTAPPFAVPLDQMLTAKQTDAAHRATYIGEDGQRHSSSRDKPSEWAKNAVPLGTWRVDDSWAGNYGHTIEQLQEFDPHKLVLSEDDYYGTNANPEGRGWDAKQYAEWIKEGKEPPPIHVLQMENGQFKVSDGHRRAAAAKFAGVPIKAWVSPTADTGKKDWEGKPILTAATYQTAVRDAVAAGQDVPQHARQELAKWQQRSPENFPAQPSAPSAPSAAAEQPNAEQPNTSPAPNALEQAPAADRSAEMPNDRTPAPAGYSPAATREEFIRQEVERLRGEYPDNEDEAYQAQAEANASDWKPPAGDGARNVGDVVKWNSKAGSVDAEYRGTFDGPTGKMAAVIVREAGKSPYQTSVPVSELAGNAGQPKPTENTAATETPAEAPAATPADWREAMQGQPRWQRVDTLRSRQPHELTHDEFHSLKTWDHGDDGSGNGGDAGPDPSFPNEWSRDQKSAYESHLSDQWHAAHKAAGLPGRDAWSEGEEDNEPPAYEGSPEAKEFIASHPKPDPSAKKPRKPRQKHPAVEKAAEAASDAPPKVKHLIDGLHKLGDVQTTGQGKTTDLAPGYAEGMHKHLSGMIGRDDGFGQAHDLSDVIAPGAVGYHSPAGVTAIVPPQFAGDPWEARYSAHTAAPATTLNEYGEDSGFGPDPGDAYEDGSDYTAERTEKVKGQLSKLTAKHGKPFADALEQAFPGDHERQLAAAEMANASWQDHADYMHNLRSGRQHFLDNMTGVETDDYDAKTGKRTTRAVAGAKGKQIGRGLAVAAARGDDKVKTGSEKAKSGSGLNKLRTAGYWEDAGAENYQTYKNDWPELFKEHIVNPKTGRLEARSGGGKNTVTHGKHLESANHSAFRQNIGLTDDELRTHPAESFLDEAIGYIQPGGGGGQEEDDQAVPFGRGAALHYARSRGTPAAGWLFKENEHPRDDDGKFAEKGNATSHTPKADAPPPIQQSHKAFHAIKATKDQQDRAINNADDTEGCDQRGTDAEQDNFWAIAHRTLEMIVNDEGEAAPEPIAEAAEKLDTPAIPEAHAELAEKEAEPETPATKKKRAKGERDLFKALETVKAQYGDRIKHGEPEPTKETKYYLGTGRSGGYYTLRNSYLEDAVVGYHNGKPEVKKVPRSYYLKNLGPNAELAIHAAMKELGDKPLYIPGETAAGAGEARPSHFKFGKHAGKTIAEVHEENPGYIPWLLAKGDFLNKPKHKKFKERLAAFIADNEEAQGQITKIKERDAYFADRKAQQEAKAAEVVAKHSPLIQAMTDWTPDEVTLLARVAAQRASTGPMSDEDYYQEQRLHNQAVEDHGNFVANVMNDIIKGRDPATFSPKVRDILAGIWSKRNRATRGAKHDAGREEFLQTYFGEAKE